MKTKCLSTYSATLCLLLAPQLPAQEPSGRTGIFVDSVDVTVANVEVHVTKKRRGWPVDNLQREDFELLVDGKPAEIVNFHVVRKGQAVLERSSTPLPAGSAAEADPAVLVPSDAQRLNIVVFVDLVFARYGHLKHLIPEVQRFVAKRLPAGSLLKLVVFDGRVKTLVPFTEDASAVVTGLEQLKRLVTQGDLYDAQAMQILNRLVDETSLLTTSRPFSPVDVSPEQVKEWNEWEEKMAAEWRRAQIRRSWRSLQLVVDSLSSGIIGRKVILHVSEGVPLSPMQTFQRMGIPAQLPDHEVRDLERMVQHANANGVTFYALYAGGNVPRPGIATADIPGKAMYNNPDLYRAMTYDDDANRLTTLHLIAEATGGLAIAKPTPSTLEAVERDLGTYYSIGYAVPEGKLGAIHKVEVKVRKRGVTVRHRRSSWQVSGDEQLLARAYSALVVDALGNPLELSWQAGDRPSRRDDADERAFAVPITVRVPADRLAFLPSQHEGKSGQLRLFLVSRHGDGGKVSPMKELLLPVDLDGEIDFAEALPMISYRAELPLRPGTHDVAITAYDEVAKVAATRTGVVTVDHLGSVTYGLK